MVQQELYPSDERHEGNGNTGEPHADQATPGVSETVVEPIEPGIAPAVEAVVVPIEPGIDPHALPCTSRSRIDPADALSQRLGVEGRARRVVQTLFSAAVYATLIVTFGFQVARGRPEHGPRHSPIKTASSSTSSPIEWAHRGAAIS